MQLVLLPCAINKTSFSAVYYVSRRASYALYPGTTPCQNQTDCFPKRELVWHRQSPVPCCMCEGATPWVHMWKWLKLSQFNSPLMLTQMWMDEFSSQTCKPTSAKTLQSYIIHLLSLPFVQVIRVQPEKWDARVWQHNRSLTVGESDRCRTMGVKIFILYTRWLMPTGAASGRHHDVPKQSLVHQYIWLSMKCWVVSATMTTGQPSTHNC